MPRMDQAPPSERLIKLLLIGDGKSGKTRYAGMAAEAGFNVLYMDGDVGAQTLGMLPAKAQERIYLMSCGDRVISGQRDFQFVENWNEFALNAKMRWNDSRQQIARAIDPKTDEIWEIQAAQLDSNWVFVLDSWTSLTQSMMLKAAAANKVIMETATTQQMRPVYQGGALQATAALQMIRALRCHVIVIAHPDEFVHLLKPEGQKAGKIPEGDMIVDWTKMVPKSTSRPHGLSMGIYFTDIAWMGTNNAGTERTLDFRLDPGRVGGGHFTDRKNVEEYSFKNLIGIIGGTIPKRTPPIEPALRIIPGLTEAQVAEAAATPSPVLDGTQATTVRGTGLAGLFGKPEAAAGK